jgi:hypothetical protein
MRMAQVIKSTQGVEFFSLSAVLTEFRRRLERESGEPIQDLEVNAALLLHDLCEFLTLGDKYRERVLGKSAAAYIEEVMNTQITLKQ